MRKTTTLAHDIGEHAVAALIANVRDGAFENLKVLVSHINLCDLMYKDSAGP